MKVVPLFQRLLGQRFNSLPASVMALHREEAASTWRGAADVERGDNLLSRLSGWFAGLPAAGKEQPLVVTIEPVGASEVWRRDFNGSPFVTRLGEQDGLLTERLWPLTFRFRLQPVEAGIAWTFQGAHVLGVALPASLAPTIMAEEYDDDGVYHFIVDVRLPMIGRLVRYAGWLKPQA